MTHLPDQWLFQPLTLTLTLTPTRSPTLPHALDSDYCFVGGDGARDFGAQNTGGAARFFIVEKAAWDAGEREAVPVLRSGAFELSPTFLDLLPNDLVGLIQPVLGDGDVRRGLLAPLLGVGVGLGQVPLDLPVVQCTYSVLHTAYMQRACNV